jgi:hypothetical protein
VPECSNPCGSELELRIIAKLAIYEFETAAVIERIGGGG